MKEKKPKKEIPQLDLSFIVQDDWRTLMNEWVQYHLEIKKPYKSQRGIMACYSHLVRLSGGNIETAYLIVEQSEANNYQGLFQLKEDYGRNNNQSSRQGNSFDGTSAYGNKVTPQGGAITPKEVSENAEIYLRAVADQLD